MRTRALLSETSDALPAIILIPGEKSKKKKNDRL
jgi:hypothetical protein